MCVAKQPLESLFFRCELQIIFSDGTTMGDCSAVPFTQSDAWQWMPDLQREVRREVKAWRNIRMKSQAHPTISHMYVRGGNVCFISLSSSQILRSNNLLRMIRRMFHSCWCFCSSSAISMVRGWQPRKNRDERSRHEEGNSFSVIA